MGRIPFFMLAVLLAILLGIIVVKLVRTSDTYIKTVLTKAGDTGQGHAFFEKISAVSHGLEESSINDLS